MKGLIVALAILLILFITVCIGFNGETNKRQAAEKALADTTLKLNQTGDVLAEVRALRQDVSQVEAGLKALSQQRNAAGENRRENIKTALAGNDCAVAPVPVAGADSLYRRAEEVSAADYSGAFARKSDGKN
ncbi:DUF2570 domain-containing protein [Klebsiella michiganensis]|uniref:DUF2570 domain-containing protein n=1 Tax=Klebsiella michiganensis TaxID=1134687 RepID=UPI001D10C237|nr:DUF2570 domain-containing protein [Klebsiella michiganensis]MDK3149074.1 DUF2570 domain-containing protein [Klebsiella michiganensis]MDV1375904.1 DUF2570 domain-containing protein [Klebsiella michiganensis]MDV1430412.1 DUF2570 domain-containing protein [Klebsiella michiganensis]MDV1946497.1 DUF2570 domain-containing protein [Klebsiella michiganensis]UDV49713.1 DUF2570 domain-containing protein [Klebsiella michiganensis]